MSRHTFFCIDAHTCGNPVRVVTSGAPLLPNLSMPERRQMFVRDYDWIRRALMFEPRGHDVMSGVILMWCDEPHNPRAHARNVVFYGAKALDRSPCGTGSSARMPQLAARGRLRAGADFVHESVIGTLFDCRIESETHVGSYRAINPSVAGWARIIGHNTIFVDDRDPLAHGFQLL